MTKSRLLDLLKLLTALGLLAVLVSRIEDPAALWQQILQSNKVLLVLGGSCYAAAVATSALKWGLLLKAAGIDVQLGRLLSYQWVAEFFNNFLPAQVGGDVMRGYAVATDTQRRAVAAASVLIDRFIGLLVFMGCAAIASTSMLLWGQPDGQAFTPDGLVFLQFAAAGSSLVMLALIVAVTALLSRRLKRVLERLLERLPFSTRTLPVWRKLGDAFDIYRGRLDVLLGVGLLSLLIVVLTSVNIWLIATAISPGHIMLLEVLVINPIIVFALLVVPFLPGGLGIRQVSFALLFSFVGAGAALGTAVGLVQQLIGYVVSIPGGILWVRGRRAPAPENALPS